MKVCRTCANTDFNKSPMLKLFNKPKLLKYIERFTGLLLTRQIGMPEYICDTCLQDLERAIRFRQRCIETQTKLSRNYDVNSVRVDQKTEDGTDDNAITFTIDGMPERQDELIHFTTEYENSLIETTVQDESSEVETQNELNCDYDDNSVRTEKKTTDGTDDSVISFCIETMSEFDNSLIETTAGEESSEVVQENFKKRIRKIGHFVCEICGRSFTFMGNFRDHQLRHSGEKKFNCHLCTFKFYTNRELVMHMRRHTGERPYGCKYCDTRFTGLSAKAKHEKRHMTERNFKCEECDKSFVTSGYLKTHMLIHTGVRSHCCTVCDQWFLRRTHLSTHLRSKGHMQNLASQELNDVSDDDEN